MRAVSCILIIALVFSARAAAPVACDAAVTGGDKCIAGGDAGAGQPVSCKAVGTQNYYLTKSQAGAYSCTAGTPGACPALAPYTTGGTQAPPAGTCAGAQPTVPADATVAKSIGNVATATAACVKTTANNVDTYSTPTTPPTTGDAFTATPANTWTCLNCPAGCVNCDPASGKALNPAAATQTNCKTAATGYYLGTTADATSGNFPVTQCPTAVSSTYGGNATAASCTACASATNCTKATCGDGYVYASYANVAGLGNISAISGVNFTTLDATKVGALQGCYKVSDLNLYKAATTNGVRMAVSALIVAVAAVFAF